MRQKRFDSINVVPFIDIMLVLLTIVLASATFIKNGQLPVHLPSAAAADAVHDSPAIDITKGGQYMFGGEACDLNKLGVILDSENKNIMLTVRADREAQIQPLADLMSLLKAKGFAKVSLMTQTEK